MRLLCSKYTKNVFVSAGGAHRALPDPLAGFEGHFLAGSGKEGRKGERGREKRRRKGVIWKGRPLILRIPGSFFTPVCPWL